MPYFMKKQAVVSLVIWSIVAFLLLGVLIFGLITAGRGDSLFGIAYGDLKEIYNVTQDGEAITDISISWSSGSVRVLPSPDNEIHIAEHSYYDREPMRCTVSGDKLILEQRKVFGFFFFGFGTRSSDLELLLPEKQYDEFMLKMTSGKTELKTLSAKTMQLYMTSGNLEGTELKAEELTGKVTSGQMKVQAAADDLSVKVTSGKAIFSGSYGNMVGDVTSGNVEIISDVVPEKLEGYITSGKAIFTIPENNGFSLNFKKTSGNLKSDFELMSSIKENSDLYKYGDGSRSYIGKITSGTMEIRKGAVKE